MADDAEPGRVKIVGELASKPVLLPGCVSAFESAIESPSTCGAGQRGLQGVEAMVTGLTGSLRQGGCAQISTKKGSTGDLWQGVGHCRLLHCYCFAHLDVPRCHGIPASLLFPLESNGGAKSGVERVLHLDVRALWFLLGEDLH